MFPTLFSFGPITLHTYGLLVAAGFLTGLAILRRTARVAGIKPDQVDGLSVLLLLSGLLGARIMYFAVEGFAGLREDPLSFFRIWEGGLVFYGSVAGALVAATVFARRHGVRFIALCDALIPPALIAHAIGRLGCLAAGCCYGKPAGTWPGIIFTDPGALAPRYIPLLPTQILEAGVLGLLFLVSMRLFKRGVRMGGMTAYYLCGYAVVRFLMEFLRGDDRGAFILGLSPSQAFAIPLFVAGAALLIYVNPSKEK